MDVSLAADDAAEREVRADDVTKLTGSTVADDAAVVVSTEDEGTVVGAALLAELVGMDDDNDDGLGDGSLSSSSGVKERSSNR